MNPQAKDASRTNAPRKDARRTGESLCRFSQVLPKPLLTLLRLWVLTAPVGSVLIASEAFQGEITSLATTGAGSLAVFARALYPAFFTLWLFVVGFWIFTRVSSSREALSLERLAYPFISLSFALYLIAVLAWIGGG